MAVSLQFEHTVFFLILLVVRNFYRYTSHSSRKIFDLFIMFFFFSGGLIPFKTSLANIYSYIYFCPIHREPPLCSRFHRSYISTNTILLSYVWSFQRSLSCRVVYVPYYWSCFLHARSARFSLLLVISFVMFGVEKCCWCAWLCCFLFPRMDRMHDPSIILRVFLPETFSFLKNIILLKWNRIFKL